MGEPPAPSDSFFRFVARVLDALRSNRIAFVSGAMSCFPSSTMLIGAPAALRFTALSKARTLGGYVEGGREGSKP